MQPEKSLGLFNVPGVPGDYIFTPDPGVDLESDGWTLDWAESGLKYVAGSTNNPSPVVKLKPSQLKGLCYTILTRCLNFKSV